MIPDFPEFKPLELTDREEIERFISTHEPYSDYNFVSLWSYDVDSQTRVSFLHENLVLRFSDYISGEFFYSFLGNNKQCETAKLLLHHAQNENITQELRLVPESSVSEILEDRDLVVQEDRANFDYILDTEGISQLKGSRYERKRNMVNRFLRKYSENSRLEFLDLQDQKTKETIFHLFSIWERTMGRLSEETQREYKAVERLFQASQSFDLYCMAIFIQDQVGAFLIAQHIHNDHVIVHFEKANIGYEGIYEYLNKKHAENAFAKGYPFLNYEQDLGIEGLRITKTLYAPLHFLKKYIIKNSDHS